MKDKIAKVVTHLAEILQPGIEFKLQYLSSKLGVSKEIIRKGVDQMRANGINVVADMSTESVQLVKSSPSEKDVKPLSPVFGSRKRILLMSDAFLGSKLQQNSLVHAVIKHAEGLGVDFAIFLGNMIAGKPTSKTKQHYFLTDTEEQIQYARDNFPVSKKFKIYVINGPSDISSGKNVAEEIATGRDDLVARKDLFSEFDINGVKVIAAHSKKSGPGAYTLSYPVENLAASQIGVSEWRHTGRQNFQIMIVGGHFVGMHQPPQKEGGYHMISVPGLYNPSDMMDGEKKIGSPMVGFVVMDLIFDEKGKFVKPIVTCYNLSGYTIEKDYLEEAPKRQPSAEGEPSEDQKKVLDCLLSNSASTGALSRLIGKDKTYVEETISGLQKLGFELIRDEAKRAWKIVRDRRVEFKPINIPWTEIQANYVEYLLYGDTQIGSDNDRPKLIPKIYKLALLRKVQKILHAGDVTDGKDIYAGHSEHLVACGADNQKERMKKILVPIYKKHPEMPNTEVISGNHDMCRAYAGAGHDVVEAICDGVNALVGRKVLIYLGHDRGDSNCGRQPNKIKVRLLHPDGGIPMGRSYRLQETIRKLILVLVEEGDDIHSLAIGHLHVALFMLNNGIAGFMVPGMQGETDYLIRKALTPQIGCWVVRVCLDGVGDVISVTPEYFDEKELESM
ncbi:MAG: hypothetical protein AAB465_02290 [Patescibacteria group bacterium]